MSFRITVCLHSASLVMPNGDSQGGFFYPTLTSMLDSYVPLYYFTHISLGVIFYGAKAHSAEPDKTPRTPLYVASDQGLVVCL